MSIEEQIEQALAEGRRIRANAHNLFWFTMFAAAWTVSADLRNSAFAIVQSANQGATTDSLAFRCYDLAVRIANDEYGTHVAARALEAIYQVQNTREI
jgi:hypothetical protein